MRSDLSNADGNRAPFLFYHASRRGFVPLHPGKAKAFGERAGISAIVLARVDGDARGGAALSMRAITGKPIVLIGVGERIADFDKYPFCIPAVRNLDVLELHPDVTFLVGRKVLRSRHCPQRRHW